MCSGSEHINFSVPENSSVCSFSETEQVCVLVLNIIDVGFICTGNEGK